MRDVALYKAHNGLAVEDREREAVVIQKAQESAARAGLDAETVAPFYRMQIQAAKAIQYRYLADWTFVPDLWEQPVRDLELQIRPRLIQLGNELTSALGTYLGTGGCFQSEHLPLFLASVDVEHLREDEKIWIFESMSAIDLAPPHAHCGRELAITSGATDSSGAGPD